MARKKIGKIDTETMLIIGAVGLVAVYFLTRTTAQPVNPYGSTLVTGPGGQYVLPGNQTAQIIQAGSQGAAGLLSALDNIGIFG